MPTCTMFWRTCRRSVDRVRLPPSRLALRRTRNPDATYAGTTKATKIAKSGFLFVFFVSFVVKVTAQGVAPGLLLKPTPDSWPTYHGDYTGQHHSRLTQITPANVKQMTLSWAFQTNLGQGIKATPIVVNGVIYLSGVDNLWAIDARSGRQIWRYTHPQSQAFSIGHRGVAVRGDLVYLTTRDARLIALDARNGAVKWNVEIADWRRGYWCTNAPMIIRDHVIVGVSGDFDNLPGILRSFDAETGTPQWTFHSTPPPGTPGSISGGATGGQMWMTGTYDPELNLYYVGTGNPTPVLNGPARPGDNKWTGSIVALNPDTGEMKWGFQAVPHDTHDWDAAEVPVLVDANFRGTPRKLLLQASRNGYYFVLDRTTGQNRDGRLVAPDEAGGTNYRSPAFDPATGLLIVSAHDAYGIYFFKPEHGSTGWAGADYTVHGRGVLRAIEYQTGRIRWSHDLHGGAGAAGVLTTATGVTFTGDSANSALALRTSDGSTLWHSGIGRVGNSPITYELDGRQHVLFGGGSALYAFALP